MFKRLCHIEFRHLYYEQIEGEQIIPGLCKDVRFAPTSSLAQLIQQSRLFIKQVPGRLDVLVEDNGEEQWFIQADEPLILTFNLTIDNPEFLNFTNLPIDATALDPSVSVYYLTNQSGEHGTTALIQLPAVSPVFQFQFEEYVGDAVLEIAYVGSTTSIWSQRIGTDELVDTLNIDLQAEPEGRYQLWMNGEVVYDFYLTREEPARIWGVAEYCIANPGAAEADRSPLFTDVFRWDLQDQRSTILLENRACVWKYIIQHDAGFQYDLSQFEVVFRDKVVINGMSRHIEFERIEDAGPGIHGYASFVSKSKNPIPLLANPVQQYQIQLHAPEGSNEQPLDLPFATPKALKIEGDNQFVSEVFIYI